MTLSGLADSDAAIQVHALQFCMSRETLTIIENRGLTDAQKADQAQIIAALKQHVQGRINVTVECRNFRQLRELAKTCSFCNNNCLQSNLRDQLVDGVIDPDTVQEFLKEQNRTLEKAMDTGRAMEAAKKELHSRPGMQAAVTEANSSSLDSASGESVNAVSKYKQARGRRPPPVESGLCNGCGQTEHPEGRRASCPAFKSACSNCGKVGHYHTVCRQPKSGNPGLDKKRPHQTNSLSLSGLGVVRIRPSMMALNYNDPTPTLTVHVQAFNGQANVEVLPDSGADICSWRRLPGPLQ